METNLSILACSPLFGIHVSNSDQAVINVLAVQKRFSRRIQHGCIETHIMAIHSD